MQRDETAPVQAPQQDSATAASSTGAQVSGGNAPRERPIAFSPAMVRALLEGRKTQTRQLLTDPRGLFAHVGDRSVHPAVADIVHVGGGEFAQRARSGAVEQQYITTFPFHSLRCPHGVPGDRLWVRERHSFNDVRKSSLSRFPLGDGEFGPDIWDVAVEFSDGYERELSQFGGERPRKTRERGEPGWRPASQMPRWASRVTVEITNVYAHRLNVISAADAEAEGVDGIRAWRAGEAVMQFGMHPMTPVPVFRFAKLWESVHGDGSWAKNPWVWAITFRRLKWGEGQ
jgi:hypothetical protein